MWLHGIPLWPSWKPILHLPHRTCVPLYQGISIQGCLFAQKKKLKIIIKQSSHFIFFKVKTIITWNGKNLSQVESQCSFPLYHRILKLNKCVQKVFFFFFFFGMAPKSAFWSHLYKFKVASKCSPNSNVLETMADGFKVVQKSEITRYRIKGVVWLKLGW